MVEYAWVHKSVDRLWTKEAPMAITHAIAHGARHPKAASESAYRRAIYKLRALTERREGARYRAAYGPAGFSRDDIRAMISTPDLPVSKRHRPLA